MKPEENLQLLVEKASESTKQLRPSEIIEIIYGSATCENAAGAAKIEKLLRKLITESKTTNVFMKRRGCTGHCSREPVITIQQSGKSPIHYYNVNEALCREIFHSHVISGQPVGELSGNRFDLQNQNRVALRNCGIVDPESFDDYLLHNGFRALAKVLEKGDSNWPIDEVMRSNLRGRGGAGYPSGLKWKSVANSKEQKRYLICNADEGDPGAFMDRDMLESDPFSIIEGMLIVAYSIGAEQGYFYIRSEYPLAIQRVEKALALCRENGILGKSVLGSPFSCDIEIRPGAGAFVCGEETALIASIEGKRGWPRIRPPYPADVGLWGKPTIINNVETFANVPAIIEHGAEWFSKIGSAKSGGTKVFALSGKIENTGLVEVPMGTTLRKIVYEFGGGVPDGKALKAVQTGGPAGGCIPAEKLDTPIDYDTLMSVGSIMGSGGMIVMDETKCMVDTAKFFMAFSQDESCGQCTPCREGTKRILEILERITNGSGVPEDIDKLERLCNLIKKASLCGLGRAAPNPVLSTLRYFRNEYEIHINDKRCPTGQCQLK